MDLDERLLGKRLPGGTTERKDFLKALQELVDEYGEQWVIDSRERLLMEIEWIHINTIIPYPDD
jgi:hypothetical protein